MLLHFVREFYRQDLKGRGVPIKDLAFETRNGEPVVHLIRGVQPAAYYNGAPNYDSAQQYAWIAAEIPAGIGRPDRLLIFIFAETYNDGPSPAEWPGSIARRGRRSKAGGLGVKSVWILRDEFSAILIHVQRRLLFDTTRSRAGRP